MRIIYILLAGTIVFFSNTIHAQVNLNQGLVAYLPFNGSASDVSGNANHGLVQNGVQLTTDRYGNANSAYEFDGIDDYIRLPFSPSLNFSTGYSFAAYIYPTQTSVQTIIGKISYTAGIGTQFQVGLGFSAYPGVFFGLNPPTVGCNTQVTLNTSYINTGVFNLNQWNCIVATYQNGVQKIYLNGVMIQSVNTSFATLNQCTNSDIQIGSWWSFDPQRYKGKIDDVRLYNRALNDQEVAALCLTPPSVQASFTAPDTVCVNSPVNIVNTTVGGTNYYWNFCLADVNTVPVGVNLGNPGGLSQPVFMDIVEDNGNFYGFVVNHIPGGIVRLDFGNSLLNSPTSVSLGNPNNAMNANYGNEGIQVVKSNGNWYAVIVGGNPASSTSPRLVIVKFGPNLNNNTPSAVNWGNIGNMLEPIDLHVFQENGTWYGFTVNAVSNTITRFNFTNSFENAPTGINLGNIGGLSYPDGIHAVKENGNWRVFITNGLTSSSISRLDFGSSLLNIPTGVNLGNPGGGMNAPRDLTILNYCGQSVGFVTNTGNSITRLNFTDLGSSPTATNLGNIGTLSFPHSLSKLFRVGNDIYSFITNVQNNTITRLRFSGCSNSSIPGSNLQTPPVISYNSPGTYFINLSVDDGLPTQTAYCRKVVVMPGLTKSPTQNLTKCSSSSIKVGSSIPSATYLWNTGASTDSIIISTPGIYWVETSRYGCMVRDSFVITNQAGLVPDFAFQQNMCLPKNVQFSTSLPAGQTFSWDFGNGQTNTTSQTPQVGYQNYGTYTIKLKTLNSAGCYDSIQKSIPVQNVYDNNLVVNVDTSICPGDSLQLQTYSPLNSYCWKVTSGVTPDSLNAIVHPTGTTTYVLTSEVPGANLVINPNFSQGNNGFTSDYSYSANNVNEGEYFVSSSAGSWNPSFSNCIDHTTGNGQMLLVNGASSSNANVWAQSISVAPNTSYNFSFWMTSLHALNPANLELTVNGKRLGVVITAGGQTCQWSKVSTTWNSGNLSNAVISIVNVNTQASGNDFAIDDIFFGSVTTKTDSFTVSMSQICDSINIAGPDKICSASDTVTYSIFKSQLCTQQVNVIADNAYVDVISQTSGSVKLVFKQEGQTSIKLSYSDNCTAILDSVNVTINFSPDDVNLGPDLQICKDSIFLLNAGEGFINYTWQDGSSDSVFQVNTQGLYYVTAYNFCGNAFSDSISVVNYTAQPFVLSPTEVSACIGDSVQFTASGGNAYVWQPSTNFSNPSSSSTKAIITNSATYSVQIFAGCGRDTTMYIPVTATTIANIQVTKSNDVSCSNDSAILKASGGTNYTWSPNVYMSSNQNTQVTVRPPQTMTYYVTGVDAGGCTGKDSIQVVFTQQGDQKLYVPNAFTPNGDGINDVFRPRFIGPAKKYQFRIYNRWGQLVFKTETPGVGWNGIYQSKLQPGDVYVYYLTAEGSCNGKFEEKGSFVLIK